jgi:hypothetical protein
MLPILFSIVIPAWLVKPAAVLAVHLVVLGRALAWRRRSARDGHPVSMLAALADDWVVSALLVAALAVLWRAGLLSADLRLPLHSYGLLIATGFITGIWLAQREGKRRGQDPERIADLTFWILVAAMVGSRVYFILVNWRDYFEAGTFLVNTSFGRIPRVLAIWEGGLVFYGGFIGSVLVAWLYMRRHGMNFLAHADTLIPSVALGHFFGRLGCFGAGCCWGDVAHVHWPWMVHFAGVAGLPDLRRTGHAGRLPGRRPQRHAAAPPDPALRVVRRAGAVPAAGAGGPAAQALPRPGAGGLAAALRGAAHGGGVVPRRRGAGHGAGAGGRDLDLDGHLRGRPGDLRHRRASR